MIDRIIAEIRSSVSRGDYLLALMGALSLPGICGKAEYPDLKQKQKNTIHNGMKNGQGNMKHMQVLECLIRLGNLFMS